ncbi:MAG TPA: winged helix-turn-helix domain-containing protein, partial [Bacillales bacterium]|nr:winged helix-turn-helix domain-containing protein [Bacillales bacterium]
LCETYFLLNEADKGKALLAEGLRKANDPSNDYFHRFKVLEAKFAARDHAHETYQKAIAHFSQHERWQLVMELSKELIYFQDHNAFPFENRTAADSESRSDEAVCLGYGIYFDPKAHWVGRPDRPNALSKHEIQLMRLFVKHRGEPLQTAEIAERIWHGAIENNSVRKAIHRLKKKLGPASELLSGRPQGGYVLQKDNTPVP